MKEDNSGLRIAVIGCGRIGGRHAEHIANMANLVAVCDIVPERASELAEKYNCKKYFDYEEMLKQVADIDLVSICTPNGLHAKHTIKCLRSDANVLVEKPMALTVIDCERMIDEAEKANKRLFVVKQNRFNAPVQALKGVLQDGLLGDVYAVQLNCIWNRDDNYYRSSTWHGTLELDGGILFTQYSHFIDLLYWLFGDLEMINGYRGNYAHTATIEFEDTGVAVFKLRGGAIGTMLYTINSNKTNYEGSLTVIAQKGTVKVGGKYLNTLEYQSIDGHTIGEITETGKANDYGAYQGSMSNHDRVYENVIGALTKNMSIQTNFMDGMKTVQIIENIYKSMQWSK